MGCFFFVWGGERIVIHARPAVWCDFFVEAGENELLCVYYIYIYIQSYIAFLGCVRTRPAADRLVTSVVRGKGRRRHPITEPPLRYNIYIHIYIHITTLNIYHIFSHQAGGRALGDLGGEEVGGDGRVSREDGRAEDAHLGLVVVVVGVCACVCVFITWLGWCEKGGGNINI